MLTLVKLSVVFILLNLPAMLILLKLHAVLTLLKLPAVPILLKPVAFNHTIYSRDDSLRIAAIFFPEDNLSSRYHFVG
jgi:hypothetical protein